MKLTVTFILIFFNIVFGCKYNDTQKKYRIDYAVGQHIFSDYTERYHLQNGTVTYFNEKGVKIVRCGTFSIVEQK